eukprot:TRINITY_DN26696_c0_g2_i1.p2 TRINITY_DN26696_c0_g2~~TRINITY_DN26696_c0_g2_i1.p2  ORF type:complete len:501 (-),score=29.89 TRINITY_DN26696_c0_g2_i1:203-1489(-)
MMDAGAKILVSPKLVNDQAGGKRLGLLADKDIQEGEDLLIIDGNLCVTTIDAQKVPEVTELYKGDNELTLLALWLCFQRIKNESSYKELIETLPDRTNSPILWTSEQIGDLLQGCSIFESIQQQRAMMESEWQILLSSGVPGSLTKEMFMGAWCTCFAHLTYLPTAQCVALVPLLGHMRSTGNNNGCNADFDLETGCVKVTTTRPYRQGQEVMLNDQRNSGEIFMAKGYVDESNAFDFMTITASLVQADRLYNMKKEILESYGLEALQQFPIMEDRIPLQLLSYLRLSRVQDAAQIAKISFDNDVIISQSNEYEVLQLLMAECRDRIGAFKTQYEQDVKLIQAENLTLEERLACKLRLNEKRILGSTMDAVRRRLAPIRGIPTKSGKMADPNQDIREIFDVIETLPQKPKQILDDLFGWNKNDPKQFR